MSDYSTPSKIENLNSSLFQVTKNSIANEITFFYLKNALKLDEVGSLFHFKLPLVYNKTLEKMATDVLTPLLKIYVLVT